jgi:nitrate reductase assembly molybdenum cofactor insertion protein NarJ
MTAPIAVYERVLRDAAEWRLLGLLFEYPGEGWREEVGGLLAEVADPALRQAGLEAESSGQAGAYLAALGPGGSVSPREAGHAPLQDPGRILADIAAFYDAFQYRPRVEEPADHVAVQAGFIGYLKLKEAFARARAAAGEAEMAASAADTFRARHLALVAESLARRLAGADPGYLALAAEVLSRRAGRPTVPAAACAGPAAGCPEACDPGECGDV